MPYVAGQKLQADDLGQSTTAAEYQQNASQSISHVTNTELLYNTANQTSTLVTRATSGSGHSFTLERAGIWAIAFTEAFTANATGYREFWAEVNGSNFMRVNYPATTASDASYTVSKVRPFAENDVVIIWGVQSSGGALNRVYVPGSNTGRVNFAWLGG
jgi:hypothetical protein